MVFSQSKAPLPNLSTCHLSDSSFVAQFCKDFDLKIPKQKSLTAADLSEDAHQENKNKDGKLDLKWSPPAGSQGCSDSCEKIFLAFVRDLQCKCSDSSRSHLSLNNF
jgi:hypothetical protein